VAAVLVVPSKVRTCYAVKLDFSCTNNIVEYEALLLGLRKLKAMGIRRAILKTDSRVISGHIDKSSKAREKGKCALGPFLSILVIKCQHKWFKCETMPNGG
jgi:ribonuclease HI